MEYGLCNGANLEEQFITAFCTLRVCSTVDGAQHLTSSLTISNASLATQFPNASLATQFRCAYGERLQRYPNAFALIENAANANSADPFV